MEKKREEIAKAIKTYIKARKHFLVVSEKNSEYLTGNDNIIGRIGEYYAIRFLESQGRTFKKAASNSQAGYDLICDNIKISVKIITAESMSQRTSRLTGEWDELFLIELNESYRPSRIGHLTKQQHNKASKENPSYSKNPYIKITMLGSSGLISRYGKVYTELQDYLE